MPTRPLIVFPAPVAAAQSRPPGGGGQTHLPDRAKQAQRLELKFEALKTSFDDRKTEIKASAISQVPEDVIVFETIGSVEGFLNASKRIPELDFLAEWDVEDVAPDNDFYDEKQPRKLLNGRIFLIMSNQQALEQLLKLWRAFKAGGEPPRNFAAYFALFNQLRDVRRWGTKDRLLETGVIEYWQSVADAPDQTLVPFEIELWFRNGAQQRLLSLNRIRSEISRLKGEIVSVCELEAICYHAAVVRLPVSEIRRLADRQDVTLLGESSVMFFRPSGQTLAPTQGTADIQAPSSPLSPTMPDGEATVALFDGLPLENHVRLAGRLRVDDPDGYASNYTANERDHGTTMASIILHGDLNAPRLSLRHPLYVRPILRPDPQSWNSDRSERVPFGVNALDLTHRAVRRLFEAEGSTPPAAPGVKIINFSIGDPLQQFNVSVSAWGRLLDWLAVKYNVLFCVSGGNHGGPVELDVARPAFAALAPEDRENEFLKAILADLRLRRILAPSDSINAITVGAWHHDYGPVVAIRHHINPYRSEPLPSPINGLGCGFRNATKPDILLPGGRQFYSERLGNVHTQATLEVVRTTVAPGILAATPNSAPGSANREKHTRGTSNATALATRSAAFLYDQLISLRSEPGGERLSDDYASVMLKAMLIHSASWGEAYGYLKAALKPADMREDKFKRLAARFLGFGLIEPTESLVGADHRAVLLGCGSLGDGSAHLYRIPLPQSLSGLRGLRRVVATLAWLSPTNPRHRNYRGAALWFDIEKEKLAVKREDIEWRTARNGTVQHEVFQGERAAAIGDNEYMEIRVNCRADASTAMGNIRYALVVSLEVAEELRVPVYEEVVARIRPSVPISTPVR